MTNKYLSRITSSARGELFNPLTYPFFISTLLFGIGFVGFAWTRGVEESSLFTAMSAIASWVPHLWGVVAIATIIMGLTFLMFNIPPAGKISGLVGFVVWLFAGICWVTTGAWLLALAVAVPNMYFWFWQYLSLKLFRREDADDKETMAAYDRGDYDDKEHPQQSREDRENNRGVDIQ